MTCVCTRWLGQALLWWFALALGVGVGRGAGHEFTLAEGKVRFVVDPRHGSLAAATAGGKIVAAGCFDEYWLQERDGSIRVRSSEREDVVLAAERKGRGLRLRCRNVKLGIEIAKQYEPGPVGASLRKTIGVGGMGANQVLHVMSRVTLSKEFAREAYLYTPRQSWGGKRLLYGVRRVAEISQPLTSSSGWDNRLVVAFTRRRQWALVHWRAQVDGSWVPYSGIIAPWGKESPFGLTYLPDGWRFRALHCVGGGSSSAAVDYVLLRGDWYEAWTAYRSLPGYREAYKSLDTMPLWCQRVKYGTFWQPPEYTAMARRLAGLCERLGGDSYVTVGVFGWSLDGDYETERPFMMETLRLVLTPAYLERCVAALQKHPRIKVGLYIQGGLIDSVSDCFRHHRDWVIHGPDGKPVSSGFRDNPVGDMYMGNPCVAAWRRHHTGRIRAVCDRYDCGFIYLDGGGYGENVDWQRSEAITFRDHRRLNEEVLEAVRSTGKERALLINAQNAPYADMSWLECGYFNPHVKWQDTVDFCFDTACQRDYRYTLEPLYWRDNDRYLAMCVAFGFTPCGGAEPDKPASTWRAIEAAWRMKEAELVLNSAATGPVWWKDDVPVVTFAQRLADKVVVVILNFGDQETVSIWVDARAVGLGGATRLLAEVYQPLFSPDVRAISAQRSPDGRVHFRLKVPTSWRGVTLLTLKAAGAG